MIMQELRNRAIEASPLCVGDDLETGPCSGRNTKFSKRDR